MRSSLRLLFPFAVTSLLATSCSKCGGGQTNAGDAATVSSGSAAPSSQPPGARCVRVGAPIVLGERDDAAVEGPQPFGVEVGSASSDARGFVIGVRTQGIAGIAQLARIPFDGSALQTWASLPQPAGVGRPPLVALDATTPATSIVARLWSAPAEKRRVLGISRIDESGKLVPLLDIDQQEDESEYSAVLATSRGLVVAWDEADKEGRRGRIRAIHVDPNAPKLDAKLDAGTKVEAKGDAAIENDVVTPSTTDASWPTLVKSPDGKRAILLWLAEKPENADPPDGGAGEPSQLEAFRWVEGVLLDVATARPIGTPRALTALDGHAQTVAAEWTSLGLVLAVRDDARPTDGDGGELIAVKVPIEESALGAPTRSVVADKEVAPGIAFVLPREPPLSPAILYLSPNQDAHLVPLFGSGVSSVEPALQGFRAIASRGPQLLASRLHGRALELLVVRCGP